jgi:hypothetical protein
VQGLFALLDIARQIQDLVAMGGEEFASERQIAAGIAVADMAAFFDPDQSAATAIRV